MYKYYRPKVTVVWPIKLLAFKLLNVDNYNLLKMTQVLFCLHVDEQYWYN